MERRENGKGYLMSKKEKPVSRAGFWSDAGSAEYVFRPPGEKGLGLQPHNSLGFEAACLRVREAQDNDVALLNARQRPQLLDVVERMRSNRYGIEYFDALAAMIQLLNRRERLILRCGFGDDFYYYGSHAVVLHGKKNATTPLRRKLCTPL
jgi:hypothetical protein